MKIAAKKKASATFEKSGPEIKVYHNTRCSKSRSVCSILEEKNITAEVVEYLKTPPDQKEIKELLKMLGMKAQEIIRKGEPIYKENFADKKLTEAQWIKVLSENPILIERPIIVKGGKAIIGRPPEKVIDFLKL